jgi:Flp pilus assembly protein TadG
MRRIMISSVGFPFVRLLVRRLGDFTNDKRGVSAVEFAMLLPLMLTLYLGGVEVSQGISIDRKVTLTARTVADLVAQVATIDNNGVNAALGASAAILAPYPDSNASIAVSVVNIDSNGNVKVAWTASKNPNACQMSPTVDVPTALKTPNTSLVLGKACYNYQPTIGYAVTGSMKLIDQLFMRPRLSETVTKT